LNAAVLWNSRSSAGKEFQVEVATTLKARRARSVPGIDTFTLSIVSQANIRWQN